VTCAAFDDIWSFILSLLLPVRVFQPTTLEKRAQYKFECSINHLDGIYKSLCCYSLITDINITLFLPEITKREMAIKLAKGRSWR